jgi:hypothetical protein
MWRTSSPDDKLTGVFGNAIAAHTDSRSSVGSCYGGEIITEQFLSFATHSLDEQTLDAVTNATPDPVQPVEPIPRSAARSRASIAGLML